MTLDLHEVVDVKPYSIRKSKHCPWWLGLYDIIFEDTVISSMYGYENASQTRAMLNGAYMLGRSSMVSVVLDKSQR